MIKPITDRIFIRLAPEKETTEGGIIIVDDYHKNRNIGIVEEIGPLVSSVKKGNKVLFHPFDELPTYDSDVVVVKENSILGVFENE